MVALFHVDLPKCGKDVHSRNLFQLSEGCMI